MKPKVIKTETDYQDALTRIEMLFEAKPGSPDGDELELLITLVERYEEKVYPIDLPSPVEAIRFRMEQQGLKAKDLVAYIGSASKVSEILAGKRPLSLTMIRNLVNGLGIPAEVLLQEPGAKLASEVVLEQGRQFPLAEMVKRGWFTGFSGTVTEAKQNLEDLINNFVGVLGSNALIPTLNRQHIRDGCQQDEYALMAWRIRVANLALCESLPPYKPGTVTPAFLQEVVRLSYLESGPLLAREFLNKNGIHLICEPHLPKTHLDGAALKLPDGSCVVALTLRHDRLDNFWFTLCHELAHVALHLDQDDVEAFFDDVSQAGTDRYENEADALASESLIPAQLWESAQLTKHSSSESVVQFAEQIRISPAIPAGRIRYENKAYMRFKSLIGNGTVKAMFGVV
ncbi:ImmA/IrrE family metallo-endopeptidase [Candidatus Cyanaurora vandensis]|uniref:ImmA/IrrE family metallo-endopeptidase n=1 Tax=Candidatus Cyanaurora vandensis TaxID=2714958 RepID=UPI00257D988A|nr:ImmA/IrrE family metallo-endopeptidase [Candidatus Cyanaurora vandensis]